MKFKELFVKFKVDTSDLEKKNKKAENSTKKLKKSLFDTDQYANKLTDSFDKLVRSVASYITAGLTASSLFNGIKGAAEYTSALAFQADQLQVSATGLEAYDRALKQVGGQSGEYAQNLKALSQFFGNASPALIQARIIPMVADEFSKLDFSKKSILADSYGGLTPAFVQLISKGSKGLEEIIQRQRELGQLTDEEYKKFEKVYDLYQDAGTALQYNFQRILSDFQPEIEHTLDGLIAALKWISTHPQVVKSALGAIAVGVAGLTGALVLANIEFLGIATSIGLIVAAIEKLMPLVKEFADFEDSRKDSVNDISDSWKKAIFGIGNKNGASESTKLQNQLGLGYHPIASQNSNSIANSNNSSVVNNNNSMNVSGNTFQITTPNHQQHFEEMWSKSMKSQLFSANNAFNNGRLS